MNNCPKRCKRMFDRGIRGGYTFHMPRISMLVSEEALAIIDGVSNNRTAFMVDAALKEAHKRQRELLDAEVERISTENAAYDIAAAREWEGTLGDGLEPDDSFENPYLP